MIRLLILFFAIVPFSAKGQTEVVNDTIDFGVMYRKDTMGIYINIDNHFRSMALIQQVYWKPTSDFSQIVYKNGPLLPHENRAISFRIKNSVGRNAEIAKTLTVQTTNKTYNYFITGSFRSKNAPEKEEVRNIPILKQIAKNTTKSPTIVSTTLSKPNTPVLHSKNQEEEHNALLDTAKYKHSPEISQKASPKNFETKEEEITNVVKSPSRSIDNVIKTAGNLVGTPYMYGGTSTKGFDCSGFIQYCYNQENINLPRTSRTQFTVGKDIPIEDAQPGDLVFFQGRKKDGVINHVGIIVYVDNIGIAFIHSATNGGVTISETSFGYYSERLVGIKRVL